MRIRIAILGMLWIAASSFALAQTGTGTLRGQVKDPSGAVITDATVLVTPATGQPVSVQTNKQGNYVVKGLAPGTYKVEVIATGFALFEKDDVAVKAQQITQLDASLQIQAAQQQVTVNAEAPTLDVNPANNAGAIVISGKELEALSDDPDELQSDLEALAGPSAGPNGGQMYIDGFTAGQLPPKSAIREIRINSNPFSTEYDKLGYGRIEIFTKPGTDKFHGQAMLQGNDSSFNSMNPFAVTEPSYDSVLFNGDVSGPISKKASFFVSGQRRDINNVNVLDACVLNGDTNPQLFGGTRTFTPQQGPSGGSCADAGANWIPFTDSVPNPRTRTNVSPRIDYQLSKNNTLSVRYQYWRDNQQNTLGSAYDVPTQATNTLETEQTVQVDDSQVISASVVNDTRFQFLHDVTNQTPFSTLPTVIVSGTFNAGGNNEQTILSTSNSYELQNNTQMLTKNHTFNYGGRLRVSTNDDSANSDFSGSFNFSTTLRYETMEQNIAAGLPANANGGGANQFNITLGSPQATLSYADLALYFQDDWRVRPNLTISPGLRFETQTGISDHADWAPRIALAWGIGGGGKGGPKWVVRAGSGIFYDRFTEEYLMTATLLNGITQTQYVIPYPSCFFATTPAMPVNLSSIEAQCGSAQLLPTKYTVAPSLRAPGTLQTALSLERQLTKSATLAVTYINSRGWDQLLTNNVNTPLPGTYDPNTTPPTGVYPSGSPGNIYQFESEGVYRQNQLFVNLNVRPSANLSLFGYYSLNYANSDTAGATSFPSNPYDISEDYGRAAFDVRDRVFFGGTIGGPWGLRFSPFMIFSTGEPFNLTIPDDLIGSSQFNQRPSFATSPSEPNAVSTPYGLFDTMPQPGETLIPINYGTAPNQFTMNLRVSKTFSFGKEGGGGREPGFFGGGGGPGGGGGHGGGGGGRGTGMVFGGGPHGGGQNTASKKYNLTLSVSGRNIFNNVNLAPPIGVVGPLAGKFNGLAGGAFSSGTAASRVIYLQAAFSF